jgi:hypothetical protein
MSIILFFLPCFFTPPNRPGARLLPSLALPEPFCGLIFLFESDASVSEGYVGESFGGVDELQAFLGLVDLHSVDDVSPERQVEDFLVQFDALAAVLARPEVDDRDQQFGVFVESC